MERGGRKWELSCDKLCCGGRALGLGSGLLLFLSLPMVLTCLIVTSLAPGGGGPL